MILLHENPLDAAAAATKFSPTENPNLTVFHLLLSDLSSVSTEILLTSMFTFHPTWLLFHDELQSHRIDLHILRGRRGAAESVQEIFISV